METHLHNGGAYSGDPGASSHVDLRFTRADLVAALVAALLMYAEQQGADGFAGDMSKLVPTDRAGRPIDGVRMRVPTQD